MFYSIQTVMWVWKATTCFIYIAVYLLIMADIANKNKCIFCLICEGKESTKLVYEDDNYVAFSDIKPASKYHYLIIPKQHISDAKSLVPEQKTLGLASTGLLSILSLIFICMPLLRPVKWALYREEYSNQIPGGLLLRSMFYPVLVNFKSCMNWKCLLTILGQLRELC